MHIQFTICKDQCTASVKKKATEFVEVYKDQERIGKSSVLLFAKVKVVSAKGTYIIYNYLQS